MMKTVLVLSFALSLACPAVASAQTQTQTERYGGLISLLYPERYEQVEHVVVEWVALDARPLAAIVPIAAAPCGRSWRRGEETRQCDDAFVPLRSRDSGAFAEKPRFLSSLRSFSYGSNSKMAFGMDLPGLVDTLRARTRTPDYGLGAEYVVNAPTKR